MYECVYERVCSYVYKCMVYVCNWSFTYVDSERGLTWWHSHSWSYKHLEWFDEATDQSLVGRWLVVFWVGHNTGFLTSSFSKPVLTPPLGLANWSRGLKWSPVLLGKWLCCCCSYPGWPCNWFRGVLGFSVMESGWSRAVLPSQTTCSQNHPVVLVAAGSLFS